MPPLVPAAFQSQLEMASQKFPRQGFPNQILFQKPDKGFWPTNGANVLVGQIGMSALFSAKSLFHKRADRNVCPTKALVSLVGQAFLSGRLEQTLR